MGLVHNNKVNYHFTRMAGTFSVFGGIIALASFFYLVVVLNSLGLEFKMSSDTPVLLAWIKNNSFAYSLLWVHHAVMAVFMLPVPLAASQIFRQSSNRSSSMATASYLIGLCGFYLIIIAAIVFFSVSPITSIAYSKAHESAQLIHELFYAVGSQIRLFGEFLIGVWMAGIGLHLVRKNKIDSFGWYSLTLAVSTFLIVVGKSFRLYDWEPLLGVALAFTFIWLGVIMRKRTK